MNYFLLGACLLIALVGCREDNVIPTSTSSVSTSTSNKATTFSSKDWAFFVGNLGSQGNPNQYQSSLLTDGSSPIVSLTTIASKSESYTLAIASTTIKDTVSFCYWTTSIFPPKGLQIGKSLTLRAKVKLQDVQQRGVSLVLRGDRTNQTDVLFATTQGKIGLTGTNDFTEYAVTLPYTASVDYILVYLTMLNQTTGNVSFKDVSLQVN